MERRSSVVSRPAVSLPSMRMRPAESGMSRLTIFSVVVLPQPEGPSRMQVSPGSRCMLMWSAATTGPLAVSKTLVRLSSVIIAAGFLAAVGRAG